MCPFNQKIKYNFTNLHFPYSLSSSFINEDKTDLRMEVYVLNPRRETYVQKQVRILTESKSSNKEMNFTRVDYRTGKDPILPSGWTRLRRILLALNSALSYFFQLYDQDTNSQNQKKRIYSNSVQTHVNRGETGKAQKRAKIKGKKGKINERGKKSFLKD